MSIYDLAEYSPIPVVEQDGYFIVNGKVVNSEEAEDVIIAESHEVDSDFCFPKEVYEDVNKRIPAYS